MDDHLLKKILPLGEVVERYLINNIKIAKIDNVIDLKKENEYFRKAIDLMTLDINKKLLNDYMIALFDVLSRQWDFLDQCHTKGDDELKRGKAALKAQEMNCHRVMVKNKINELAGSSIEIKQYGSNK